jgi:hypothetical protein
MELELLEVSGKINKNFILLNEDEYAYIVGSLITIKQLKTSSSFGLKTIK